MTLHLYWDKLQSIVLLFLLLRQNVLNNLDSRNIHDKSWTSYFPDNNHLHQNSIQEHCSHHHNCHQKSSLNCMHHWYCLHEIWNRILLHQDVLNNPGSKSSRSKMSGQQLLDSNPHHQNSGLDNYRCHHSVRLLSLVGNYQAMLKPCLKH